MSEATDFHPQPRPVAPPRRAQAVPRSRDAGQSPQRGEREGACHLASKEPQRRERERIRPSAWEDPEEDPRLEAALSLHNPVYPLDPPIVDVRIPVKAPHAIATKYSCYALMRQFPRAEVGDDLHMLFTEHGKNEQTRLSPDVFVALGVPRRSTRGDYDADVLGPPDFVLEVVSRSTWRTDVERKLDCYQQIGVRECLFFDATAEDRAGQGELWGHALTPEHREPLEEVALPNGERGVRSEVLGLVAYVAERVPPSGPRETWALMMRWHDPAKGADIPDYEQMYAREDAAKLEAQAAREREDAAKQEARAAREREDAAKQEARAARDRAAHEAQAFRRQIAELEERLRRRDGP